MVYTVKTKERKMDTDLYALSLNPSHSWLVLSDIEIP